MMKEALVSICALLNKHQVNYLVIGGVAVIFHGYTRATADLDFWYDPSIDNFNKIIKAFKEYGVDVSELEKTVFDPRKTFLRFPTPGFKSEFLPTIPGNVTFKDARGNAENIQLDGVSIPIIGYDDLIKNKKVTNRLKDQADIEELAKRKNPHGRKPGL
jgi:predicted nucleotidyltransferase